MLKSFFRRDILKFQQIQTTTGGNTLFVKIINIKFDIADTNNNVLNCVIKIMPLVKQSIIYEPQLTLADQSSTLQVFGTYRNYGIVNSVKYTNNNLQKN